MTEFKRTTQAVDEIEVLVNQLIEDTGGGSGAHRLAELLQSTAPVVEKLGRKAAETDPARQTYGPKMREEVRSLVARWAPLEGLARDVLQARGIEAGAQAAASPTAAAPTPPPRPTSTASSASAAAPPRPTPAAAPSQEERRARALQAAEARAAVSAGAASGASGSAAARPPASSTASAAPRATASSSKAVEPAVPSPMAEQLQQPPVMRMEALMQVVHSVFCGHGFQAGAEGREVGASPSGGPIRVRYQRDSEPAILATYVPVQRHLVVYVALEGLSLPPSRAAVQLGMPAASVQTKIDYLLVYPLVFRQCPPSLPELPVEPLFTCLAALAIPALKALGCTSKALAGSVFEDDVLWWRVVINLPQTAFLQQALEGAMAGVERGKVLPAGLCRQIVKQEVERARAEVEQRKREEERRRQRRELEDDPLRIGPPRRPQMPRGGFGIGGPPGFNDLEPGGGFLPHGPFGGPRRGGGGNPFFGGGFM